MAIKEGYKNIPVPEPLHRKLKTKSSKEGKSIVEVVSALIKQYLGEKNEATKK